MAPAFGVSKFGFERPAVGAVIYKFRRIILSCGNNDLNSCGETDGEKQTR